MDNNIVEKCNFTLEQALGNSEIAYCVMKVILDETGKPCDWQFVYANDAMAKIENVSKEELLRTRFFKLFPKADKKWFDYYYPAAYENKSFIIEDVSEEVGRYLRIHCFPVAYGYCGCIIADVKELNDSVKKCIEDDSLISGLTKDYDTVWLIKAPEMTLNLYRAKNVDYSSDLDGVRYDEGLWKYISRNIPKEDHVRILGEGSLAAVKKALSINRVYAVNFRCVENNTTKYFQANFAAVEDSNSIVLGIRNVSEIVREQQKQEKALQDALAEAKKANSAKTTFLSNMSHDIRTPMNAIVGYTNLALNHINDQAKVHNYLNKIASSSNHLLSLINDVLDMSKIESGKIQLDKNQCNLADILYNLNFIIQPEAKKKKHRFFIDTFDLRDEVVISDELRLNQVLFNLVGNASKFTPVGGTINVRVLQKDSSVEGVGLYEFHVRDNGIGMSREFISHVFEPFERERNSTVSGIEGTGLGLSIAKSIIDMMGGVLMVNSELDKGTEFIFTIPMDIVKADAIKSQEPMETIENVETAVLTGKRILVAEDNEMNREIITEVLQEAGIHVEVVPNGREAVEVMSTCEAKYYDMILMDVQMPVMDGYEATMAIRAMNKPEHARIPIIAMTANAFVSDKKKAMEVGMNGHISKPIDIEKLFDMIKSFV